MSKDIYATPESELIQESNEDKDNPLASRWQRLWASIVDGLSIGLITFPVMYFTGGFEGIAEGVQPSLAYSLFLGLVGLAVFILINGKLLTQNGQTIGKRLLGIKIVDLNGNLPTVKKHLLARYATYFLPGQIPVVGQFLSLINILFIFGNDKRCIHDHVAKTKVVVS